MVLFGRRRAAGLVFGDFAEIVVLQCKKLGLELPGTLESSLLALDSVAVVRFGALLRRFGVFGSKFDHLRSVADPPGPGQAQGRRPKAGTGPVSNFSTRSPVREFCIRYM